MKDLSLEIFMAIAVLKAARSRILQAGMVRKTIYCALGPQDLEGICRLDHAIEYLTPRLGKEAHA